MCDKFLIISTNITLIKIDNTFLAKLTSVDLKLLGGESHIDFRTQCVIMTLGAITNEIVKFIKIIEFES